MNICHTDQQQMLADMLGRYLAQNYPIATRLDISDSPAGWSPDHWSALAELGIIGALFDENSGGYGGSGFDLAVVFEQLGKALVVEPFLGALMAGRALAATGESRDVLDAMIAGTTRVTLAHQERNGAHDAARVETRAVEDGDQWRLTGRKTFIAQVQSATHMLVSARERDDEEGVSLFLVSADTASVSIEHYPLTDGGRGGDLLLDSAPARRIAVEGGPLLTDALAAGIVALSWEAVAIMDRLLTHTVDYLRTRQQFGTPIGKFQALRHRVSNLYIEIEGARSAAINAATALDQDPTSRDRAIAAAKYTVGSVGRIVAEEAIQLHGGIGMTWELPLAHYVKRLVMIDHQLGDEDHHLSRFIALTRQAA